MNGDCATSCANLGLRCHDCVITTKPGELNSLWVQVPVPALEQRVAEDRNEADALERRP